MGRRLRQAREVSDAALQRSSDAQQELISLRSQLDNLRLITRAMWQYLKKMGDLTDEELLDVVSEFKDSQVDTVEAEACPKCGRTVPNSSDLCIYCGMRVERRRLKF